MINFKNSNFVTCKPFYSFYEEFFIKWGIFFKKILMRKSQNIKFNIKKNIFNIKFKKNFYEFNT